MKVVGLTGGIGSGKSAASAILGELGATILDADKVGHQIYEPGTPCWHDLVEAFGEGIVAATGGIDRKKLAAKAEDLDARIKKLTRMRDGLRHAAACRAPSHMECPTFQRLLRAVTSGAIRSRRA